MGNKIENVFLSFNMFPPNPSFAATIFHYHQYHPDWRCESKTVWGSKSKWINIYSEFVYVEQELNIWKIWMRSMFFNDWVSIALEKMRWVIKYNKKDVILLEKCLCRQWLALVLYRHFWVKLKRSFYQFTTSFQLLHYYLEQTWS